MTRGSKGGRALARDVMRREVVTIPAGASLWEAARVFMQVGIHGAPVVDADGRVLGVISQTDLIRHLVYVSLPGGEAQQAFTRRIVNPDATDSVTASDLMTKNVVSVPPDAPLGEIRRKLKDEQVHRVLVLDGARLAGIVTPMDLL